MQKVKSNVTVLTFHNVSCKGYTKSSTLLYTSQKVIKTDYSMFMHCIACVGAKIRQFQF